MPEYFANTSPPEPVPSVLTEQEAILYLRLDADDRGPDAAQRAFRRLVETKRIRPARIGIRNRYARDELRRFVLHATELTGDAPTPAPGLGGFGIPTSPWSPRSPEGSGS